MLPGLAVLAFSFAVPLGFSVYYSFTDWAGFGDYQRVGLDNYRTILTDDPVFWRALRNVLVLIATDDLRPEPGRVRARGGAVPAIGPQLAPAAHRLLRARGAVAGDRRQALGRRVQPDVRRDSTSCSARSASTRSRCRGCPIRTPRSPR